MKSLIFKAVGVTLGGTLLGLVACETIETVKIYKKRRKDDANKDEKILASIKEAVKQRVAEIKENPSKEIASVIGSVLGSICYFLGVFEGYGAGFRNGHYDGIGKGADMLIDKIAEVVPDQFKNFLQELKAAGYDTINFYEETKKLKKGTFRRGYEWNIKNDIDKYINLAEEVKEAIA